MIKKFTSILMLLGSLLPTYAANYLTFTAEKDSSSFGIVINKDTSFNVTPFPNPNIQYSLDDGETWDSLPAGDSIILKKKGDKALLRGNNPSGFSHQRFDYNNFVMSGSIAASGSVMSLIDNEGESIEIPDTTFCCFFRLFIDCSSLTQAPELPAIKVGDDSYREMFAGCTGLTQTPALPATQLKANCYENMFAGCTSLVQGPDTLPATTLEYACYYGMFQGCSSLEKAPALPATILAEDCYNSMFAKCTSLTQAPDLLAKNFLANHCYREMFSGCTHLSQIKVNFIQWTYGTDFWLSNVADTGTFYCPRTLAEQYEYGPDRIPLGWEVVYIDDPDGQTTHYLTFTAEVDSSTFGMTCNWGYGDFPDIQYSLNDGVTWDTLVLNQTVVLAKKGDKALLKGFNLQGLSREHQEITAPSFLRSGYPLEGFDSTGVYWYPKENLFTTTFVMSGSIAASGSVMSLIDNAGKSKKLSEYQQFCFAQLFKDCTCLTQAPELPATSLKSGCYSEMFANCTGLKQAPKLPATELTPFCYAGMFAGCTNLTETPELPATEMKYFCYAEMFAGCSNLAHAPELPAIQLDKWCYFGMFADCINLTQAPELPAVLLPDFAYRKMFKGCSQLSKIEVSFSDWLENQHGSEKAWNTLDWVEGVAPTGTFICTQLLPIEYSIHKIPEGWNVEYSGVFYGTESIVSSNCHVWTEGSTLYVSGSEDRIEIYNLNGQLVHTAQGHSVETTSITLSAPGAYIVKAGTKCEKVTVSEK